MSRLRILHRLPEGLLRLEASRLHDRLGGPTLIHLPGEREPALFVSVLMHGNETTGWEALRRLLQRYRGGHGVDLPRALSLFIGNTAAAAQGLRHLPGQPDFNRVWPGGEIDGVPEADIMREVLSEMAARGLFAAVDVHNNTGLNPHYACVNALDWPSLHLATLFSRTVVYFVRPRGVASMALARLGPAVTIECGKVGQAHGARHAETYLDACLHLAQLPAHPVPAHDLDLFHTVAVVRVPPEVAFGFDGGHELDFFADLERYNFRELPPGTPWGRVAPGCDRVPLQVRDDRDRDVADRYFELVDGELRLRQAVMPSMLTRDVTVIRQDCLCYLMERHPVQVLSSAVASPE